MILFIIILSILIILFYEFIHGIIRQKQRNQIYKMAKKRSIDINKPLLVFGDPYNGIGSKFFNLFMDNYGCGDITVDLTGAPKCPNGIKSDILQYLKKLPSNSYVIFISCVLEYVDSIEEVIKEIYRVANINKNIFIVSVNKYTLTAYFYHSNTDHSKNIIYGPPFYDQITFTKL